MRIFGFFVTALILCGSLVGSTSGMERLPAAKLVAAKRVLIIAHRGNSSEAPENTLPAFESAVKVGSDLVELDYYHSVDRVPVVIHDNILDRTTNAEQILGSPKLLVEALRWSELRRLDAGTWFDAQFAGTKVPTLIESLDLIQSGSTTLIERKGGDAATIVRLLEEKKLLSKVVVQSFDWQYVAECRKLAPNLVLAALSGKPPSEKQLSAAAQTGAQIIAWKHDKIGREQIEQIHRLGCQAWVYTVDDRARAERLISDGIDGIITNKPATMLKLVKDGAAADAR